MFPAEHSRYGALFRYRGSCRTDFSQVGYGRYRPGRELSLRGITRISRELSGCETTLPCRGKSRNLECCTVHLCSCTHLHFQSRKVCEPGRFRTDRKKDRENMTNFQRATKRATKRATRTNRAFDSLLSEDVIAVDRWLQNPIIYPNDRTSESAASESAVDRNRTKK